MPVRRCVALPETRADGGNTGELHEMLRHWQRGIERRPTLRRIHRPLKGQGGISLDA
jgi:hypothetical protein